VYSNQEVTLTTHSPPFSTEKYERLEAGCSANPLPSAMNRTEYQYDRIATNGNRVKCFIIITGVIQKNLAAHLKTVFFINFFHLSNLIIFHYVTAGIIGCKIYLPYL
jgi:hypothetical protein